MHGALAVCLTVVATLHGFAIASPVPCLQYCALKKSEIDFDAGRDGHRATVLRTRDKTPRRHGLHGLLIQAQPHRADNPYVVGVTSGVDLQIKDDSALNLALRASSE